MAPRPQLYNQGGFQPVTEQESQAAFDRINASLPASFMVHQTGDVIDGLPGDKSRRKLEALRQRAADARSLPLPINDQIRETRIELQRAQSRLKQLVMPRAAGGFGLSEGDENDPADKQVADIKATIARHEGELSRLTPLEATRLATMRNVGGLLRRCEEWLRDGRPRGTVLLEAPPIDLREIVKPEEKVNDALERLRHRLRELDADRHRIESAAYPSADCKARMRER
jgi:hypothetical protein